MAHHTTADANTTSSDNADEAAVRLRERCDRREARLTIIGLGYVGLPTAVAFAKQGFTVMGADVNAKRVAAINAGRNPMKDLPEGDAVGALVADGRLQATTDVSSACAEADVVVIIVPTPVTADHQPDLSFVANAAAAAARVAKAGQLIVLESTTYPGTTEEFVIGALREHSKLEVGRDIGVAYCPERYNPGDAQHTLANVHRIVSGVTPAWAETAAALYGSLNGGQVTAVRNLKTAEAAKVIENIQRDLNIALVNELALIFERLDIDIYDVLAAAGTKWNFVKYFPGPGVGGHCLPVDPYYLTSLAERIGYHPRVILAGRAVNDAMPAHVVDLVVRGLNDRKKAVNGSKVALLGLAYKANTADARETPARGVVEALVRMGADVRVAEPFLEDEDVRRSFGVENAGTAECLVGADAVVLLTDHAPFRELSTSAIAKAAAPDCVLVDTRAFFNPDEARESGLHYLGVGRRAGEPRG